MPEGNWGLPPPLPSSKSGRIKEHARVVIVSIHRTCEGRLPTNDVPSADGPFYQLPPFAIAAYEPLHRVALPSADQSMGDFSPYASAEIPLPIRHHVEALHSRNMRRPVPLLPVDAQLARPDRLRIVAPQAGVARWPPRPPLQALLHPLGGLGPPSRTW